MNNWDELRICWVSLRTANHPGDIDDSAPENKEFSS